MGKDPNITHVNQRPSSGEDDEGSMAGSLDSDEHVQQPQTEKASEDLAKKENAVVQCTRLVLLLILLCSTVVVCVTVFMYLRNEENDDFETQYRSDALKILDGIGGSLDETLGALDAYVSRMVAQQELTNRSFPFITVPAFGIQAAKLLKLARGYQLATVHFVKPEQRDEWIEYSVNHDSWVYVYGVSFNILGYSLCIQNYSHLLRILHHSRAARMYFASKTPTPSSRDNPWKSMNPCQGFSLPMGP